MMDARRYNELMNIAGNEVLTTKEREEGWFYCCDWGYDLINKEWDDAKCCSCLAQWVIE